MPQIGKYASDSALLDNRAFFFGEVWTIDDELITIPDADRIQSGGRTQHLARSAVIVQNNSENHNPLSPVILIAPLCHETNNSKNHDILLDQAEDGVKQNSYARMRLIQPVLKKDLHKQVAEISNNKKDEILYGISEMFGIAI